MACRFPSAANHDELWKTLGRGLDCPRIVSNVEYFPSNSRSSNIPQIPTDRFDPQKHLSSNARYGCFIDDPGLFDARFFNLSPERLCRRIQATALLLQPLMKLLKCRDMCHIACHRPKWIALARSMAKLPINTRSKTCRKMLALITCQVVFVLLVRYALFHQDIAAQPGMYVSQLTRTSQG